MSTTLLDDAMAHHIWASQALIDLCRDLPTSHWPMWSRPRELAEIIGQVAGDAKAER